MFLSNLKTKMVCYLLSQSHFQGGPVTEGDLITEVVLSDTDLLDYAQLRPF